MTREEIFGPVLSVIPIESEEEVIRQANATPYGLAAAVWTKEVQRAHRVAHALKAGTVWINAYRAISFTAPFGGYKESGIGRENGLEALHEYTHSRPSGSNSLVKYAIPSSSAEEQLSSWAGQLGVGKGFRGDSRQARGGYQEGRLVA